jgi:hypothetical protein
MQSDAYKQMANGKPWADLSTNMQKAILYHHILQSVSTNLGDNLQNNTAMKMAAFTATLADVRLALGQAFLPILSIVLPVLTSFMRKIETALQYVSAFTRALFGYSPGSKASTKATMQQASAVSGLGDAIKGTSKEAKKAAKAAKANRGVAGFDEINQLADPASSSGADGGSSGGGGAGATIGGGMEEGAKESEGALDKISKSVKNFVKKFKKFFEPMKKPWEELKKSLGMVWDSIKDLWKSDAVQKFVKWLSGGWDVGIAGVIKIVSGAFKILAGAIDIVNAVLNGDFKKAWEGVKKILNGIWDIIVGVIEPIFPGFEKLMSNFGKNIKDMWNDLVNMDWGSIASKIGKKAADIWDSIKKPFIGAYEWIRDNVVLKFAKAFEDKKNDIINKASAIWSGIKGKFIGAYEWFRDSVVKKFSDVLVSWKNGIANKAADIWSSIKGKFTGAYDWFKNNVVVKFGDALVNWKNSIASKAGSIWTAIKGKFTGVYNWFKSNVVDKISSAFSKIKYNITEGLYQNVKSLINKLIGYINKPLNKIKNWSFMGSHPFSGLPTIPALAKGGITNGPMMAMIGDNPGGREVVSPLDDLQSMIGTAVMSAMKFNQGGGNNNGGDMIFNLDGRQFARIVKPHLDKESKRIGTNVRLQGI